MRKNDRLSFENDDYSRFSGPDYRQGSGHHHLPGVSGKDRSFGSWFNQSQYQTQRNFIGKGPRGYRRDDARIHEDACEALTVDPEVDASEIELTVHDGVLTLRGIVSDRKAKKRAEASVEGIRGVRDVTNELHLRGEEDPGTAGMIKNQSRLSQ